MPSRKEQKRGLKSSHSYIVRHGFGNDHKRQNTRLHTASDGQLYLIYPNGQVKKATAELLEKEGFRCQKN
jgi:hypothetical protein